MVPLTISNNKKNQKTFFEPSISKKSTAGSYVYKSFVYARHLVLAEELRIIIITTILY